MNPISVLSVVHNEEEYIEEAFTLLKPHVDDFVVIDQESTDKTVEIARKFTDKVYLFPRVYYAYAYIHEAALVAKHEWVLKCDPDERWDIRLLNLFPSLIDEGCDIICAKMFYGDDDKSYVPRLWRKSKVIWTDSFDSVPYNLENYPLKVYTTDNGGILNLRSRESVMSRYRVEGAKRLLARYGDTNVDPYQHYCEYYRKIVKGESV